LLLVEDDGILAMTEKMNLEKYGYRIVTASSGERAVEVLAGKPEIDLVLMDIDLGKGMDGTQAAEEILAMRDIPVVFLSSHTESDVVEKTERITSYGYVVKNASITVLDASIKMAFKLFYANKKTEESEQRYRFLANNVPDIMYSLDRNGLIDSVNYQSFVKYGYAETDVAGKSFVDFVHPEDREILMASYLSCIREKRVNTSGLQFRLTAADGSEIWLELNANARFDAAGGYLGEEGVLRDITERKYAEALLRESEERFQMLFENAPLGYQSLDIDGNFIEVNRQWLDTLGYEREEVIGKWFGDFLTPGYRDGFKTRFPVFKAQGRIHSEFEMVHKSGKGLFIAFDGRIGHEPNGDFKQTHCILQDITERRKADETLSATVKYYQTLLEKATDGIVLLDAAGNFKYISPPAKIMFGYAADEEITGTPDEYTHPDDIGRVLDELMKVFADPGYSPTLQYRFRTRTNEWKWVESIFTNLLANESIGSIVINFHDMTEKKIADEKIRTLLAEKELLLKEVHHRIKNNMSSIHGLLALQAGTLDDSAAIAALEEAGHRIGSMQLLYDKLYASSNYRQLPLAVYLEPLIDEVVSIFPNRTSVRIEKDLADIVMDATKLQPLGIIMYELLTNIMKYAFIGKIAGSIAVSATSADTAITVAIADDGNGMPESVDFDHSTGFGLVLVNGLTRQLGGTIRIERGAGTRIVLEFEN